jgi:hypothetical protein
MENNLALPADKMLTVVVRIEPGCLGQDGDKRIEAFCRAAYIKLQPINSGFINWQVLPRLDNSLPEIQYKTINKILSLSQAEKYLAFFDMNLDKFEEHLHDKLVVLIEQHLVRL